ncbi:class I SAM-dependent methyltransferase [Paenibacillus antri]|uniref:Class I SAM-dependent methyltransferase n=1 Tax=Paenibacillus antri TaxID=2582848 RepID=A0A5R9GI35_9BACL|nr:class I SAM-dependent methyltransferase [Paenibacillus antri]TLS52473.1 class I SAM-dependent methyltransferase [Paenibacillus antri]
MEKPIADRLLWAVQTLEVAPSDRILEIGCGHGVAVSLICKGLVDGRVLAIDQSEKMIESAGRTNADYVKEGKVKFIAAPLHQVDLRQEQFNKVLAVNVNLFWMKAARELAMLKDRLLPGGAVYLYNQPPTKEKVGEVAERTVNNLLNAGFHVKSVVIGEIAPLPVVRVVADLSYSG